MNKPVSLEDIAREYVRDQELDLRDQLLLSHFLERAKLQLTPAPKEPEPNVKLRRIK